MVVGPSCPNRALQDGHLRSGRVPPSLRNERRLSMFSQVRGWMSRPRKDDSQARGAGSIPVLRAWEKAQVSGLGLSVVRAGRSAPVAAGSGSRGGTGRLRRRRAAGDASFGNQ